MIPLIVFSFELFSSSFQLAYQVNQKMRELKKKGGLAYTLIEPDGSKFDESSVVNVGASVISFYEYLLKQWIQTGKQDD